MNHLFQHIQGHLYGAFRPRLLPTGGATAFSPLSLFAANEQGAWYDPSDFASMFQDSAGTTPVTAVEQPVGLILDKRLRLALGSELVTNGTFDSDIGGWDAYSGCTPDVFFGWSAGRLHSTSTSGPRALIGMSAASVVPVVAGRTYKISLQIELVSGTSPAIGVNQAYHGAGRFYLPTPGATGVHALVAYYTATVSENIHITMDNYSACDMYIDNVSIKEIAGNHATQATAAARPVVSARKNYLWEDLTGSTAGAGNWTKQAGVTVDDLGAGVYRVNFASDGQGVFASITGSNAIAAVIGAAYVGSVELATEAGTGTVTLREPIGAQFADTDKSLTTAWLRVSTPSFVASSADCGLWIAKKAGSISSVLVRFPQLETGATATTYQRVTTASDYDTVGFPHYLVFDGVDDALLVGTVALPADADATVGAWRDTANNGMIFTRAALSSEFFGVYDPGSAASSTATAGAPTYAVNGTAVPGGAAVTRGQMHTAFTVASPCVVEALNLDLSAFTALNIGGYGASFSLVGRLYGVVICPAQQAATRTSLRQYLASKSGATL